MVFGLNNMNMLGMNNMSFGNCSNYNIFGSMGNMFSGSIFGMNNSFGMGSCSPFMNCNGSYNFNAMAGFAVGGALLNVGMMAFSHYLNTREPQNNPTEGQLRSDFNNTQEEFNTKLKEFGATNLAEAEKMVNVQAKQDAVNSATTAKESADKDIADVEKNIADIDEKLKKLDPNASDYNEKLTQLTKQKEAEEAKIAEGSELKKAQKQAEADLKNAQEVLEAEKEKEEKLNELKELAEQLETSEKDLIQKIGKKADGYKWSRNQDLDVDAYQNEVVTEFTEKDLKQLVYQFCGQKDGSETKLKYAKALANLDDTEFLNIATNRQMQVRDFAIKYVEKHSN